MKRTFQIMLFITLAFIGFTFAQPNIKDVDFDNFIYQPFCGNAQPQTITVKDGVFFEEKIVMLPVNDVPSKDSEKTIAPIPKKVVERKYFKPYETIYGDLNSDNINEAIVLTTCSNGGVESFTEGFIYGIKDGNAEMLVRIEGGDRALGGLRFIKIENGAVIVERSRPDFTGNACCTEFAETMRYNFVNGELNPVGEKTSVELYPPTRVKFADGENQTSINVAVERDENIKRFIVSGKKGKTLNVSTSSPLATVRLYRGNVILLNPKPVNKNADITATDVLSAKLRKTEDYIFEVSNLSKVNEPSNESLNITINVEIK